MPVFKDEKRGTWYVMAWYRDWTGERKQKCKRGFPTKREAQDWERSFQMQTAADMDMTFEAFVELYTKDVRPRLKENTWLTKENIIQKKILPYFGKRKISEITTKDVIAWQNELLAYRDEQRKPYSQTYLKTLYNQLSAIFNHAVRFYELRSNPAAKAGNMGTEERKEMLFWTKAEYQRFAEAMMDKPLSYYAFEMLYWCGIREGELLALTPADFDFEAGTVKISKEGETTVSGDMKTKAAKRNLPLSEELEIWLAERKKASHSQYVIAMENHKPLTKSAYRSMWKLIERELSDTHITAHILRHPYVSLTTKKLVPLYEKISRVLYAISIRFPGKTNTFSISSSDSASVSLSASAISRIARSRFCRRSSASFVCSAWAIQW